MGRISLEHVATAVREVRSMQITQKTAIIDEIHLKQPNLLASCVVQGRLGADEQTVTRDISSCQDVARAEALQQKPFQSGSPAPFGMPSVRQSDDLSRSTYEAERFEACMQGPGYRRR